PTAAYLMPELTLVAVSLITGLFAAGVDLLYPARIVCALGVLWVFKDGWRLTFRAPSWQALLLGVVVFFIWLLAAPHTSDPAVDELRTRLASWSLPARSAFIVMRIVGAVLVVPLTEELAFRGYLQRRLVASDFTGVPFRVVRVIPILTTALCF